MKFHSKFSDINIEKWKLLSLESNTTSFFQTYECYKFYSSLSFLKPFVFGVSVGDHLSALILGFVVADGNPIKRFFTKRAIIPGGVMLDNGVSERVLSFFLKKVIETLNKKLVYTEIRNYNNYSDFKTTFIEAGFLYKPHLNFKIQIQNYENVFNSFSKSKRRQILSSQKKGVNWQRTFDKNEILEFYQILFQTYKEKVKTPLFPLEFFEKLILCQNGLLLVVKKENKVIGGMACVMLPNNTLYEWFVCGNDKEYKNLYPSVIATWAGIDFANQNNIKYFDFMGAGSPYSEYGVRNFKSKFGGEMVEYGRFLYINKPLKYNIGRTIISLIRRS